MIELAFWQSVKDSPRSADLQAYLDRYPGGIFAMLAESRLNALMASQVASVSPSRLSIASPAVVPFEAGLTTLRSALLRAAPNDAATAVGTLDANTAVHAVARLQNGTWLQIAHATGPAWIRSDAVTTADQAELAAWERLDGIDDAAMLEAFLKAYPSGPHAAAARERLEIIRRRSVAPPPAPTVVPIDEGFITVRSANLREEPSTDATRIATLPPGTQVQATGRLAEGNWLRIETADRSGWIWGPLLEPLDAAERAAWGSAERSGDVSAVERFLKAYPSGRFARVAEARLQALKGARRSAPDASPPETVRQVATGAAPDAVAAVRPEPQDRTENLFWESISTSRRAADFEAYLAQFPTGAFASLARLRISALNSAAPAIHAPPAGAPAQPGGSADRALKLLASHRDTVIKAIREFYRRTSLKVESTTGMYKFIDYEIKENIADKIFSIETRYLYQADNGSTRDARANFGVLIDGEDLSVYGMWYGRPPEWAASGRPRSDDLNAAVRMRLGS